MARELTIVSDGKPVKLVLAKASLLVKYSGKTRRDVEVAARQILSANHNLIQESSFLEVYFLIKKKKMPFSLMKVAGKLLGNGSEIVAEWVDTLTEIAYEGVKHRKKLKVLVNPHSGPGKARSIFQKTVEPIFRAANCSLDVTYTVRNGHAHEIANNLSLDWDAVVTLSGDGLIHEVINGFAQHQDPIKALRIPIAPIPTGSGNGLSLNLLGIEDGFDVSAAALNVIKGQPMKVDLFSMTQKGTRTLSFMSQAVGLMADVDIGTENLRWMGDSRFIVGLFREVIPFRPCQIQLSIKVAEEDKNTMVQAFMARREKIKKELPPTSLDECQETSLPRLNYSIDEEDGWIVIDKPLLYVYAGKGPYVGRDYMAFPVSLPDDGLIDIVVQEMSSRTEVLKSMIGADKGETYWLDSQRYFKAYAYRIKFLSNKGCLAVDGEKYPSEDFQVEVHHGLGHVLSPYGNYAVNFQACPHRVKASG